MDTDNPEIKSGRRHSQSDMTMGRKVKAQAREIVSAMDALGFEDEEQPLEWTPGKALDELCFYGGEVKALGETEDGGLHLGGFLVRFGSPTQTDLSDKRDYFSKSTDFGTAKDTDVYYHHKGPLETKDGDFVLVKKKIGHGTLTITDEGVLIDAITFNRKEYEKLINSAIKKTIDSHGWSSGTAGHLVEREQQANGSNWIKSWPLGLDASLTPTPAEPRNAAISLKAYMDSLTDTANADTPAPAQADTPAPEVKAVTEVSQNASPQQENPMTTETPAPAAVDTSVLDALKALTAQVAELKATAAPERTPGIAGMVADGKAPAQIAPALQVADEQLYELKRFLNDQLDDDSRRLWREQQEKIRVNEADGAHVKAYQAWLRNPGSYDARRALEQAAQKTALAEGTASLGGNLVPVLYSNQLVSTLKEDSILRRAGAYQFPIAGTNALKVATLTRSASAALVAEGASVAGQEPTFGVVSFDAYAYKATAVASRESIADSRFDVAGILNENFGWQFTQSENNQFGIGTGSSQPQGIAVGGTFAVSGGSTLALATANHDKFLDLYHALPYQYRPNGVWFMNDAVIKAIRSSKWATTTGAGSTTTYNQYLLTVDNSGDSVVAPFGRFMGRPIYPLNTMASSGSTAAVAVFADPRFFWISDFALGTTEIQQLNERYADNWQVGWNAWRRFDSNVMVAEAVQYMKLL